jgi:flagellar basal-body rod modification protein FlgD
VTSADGVTSGVVQSIKWASDGVVATTTAGKEITIQEGIKVTSS